MTETPPEELVLQQTQVVAIALIATIVVMAAFGTFLIVQGMVPNLNQTGISQLFAVVAAIDIVLVFVIASWLSRRAYGASREMIVHLWRLRIIVIYALSEGACFMATVGMILGHQIWLLGFSALTLFVMLFHFPTRNSFNQFLESHETSD